MIQAYLVLVLSSELTKKTTLDAATNSLLSSSLLWLDILAAQELYRLMNCSTALSENLVLKSSSFFWYLFASIHICSA